MNLNLITNRTISDVEYAITLLGRVRNNGINTLSQEEQKIYFDGLKGCYSYVDMQRVQTAIENLSNLLKSYGYNCDISIRKFEKGLLRYSDVAEYLSNISKIRSCFCVLNSTPKVPTIDEWINYMKANEIEKILLDINILIENMEKSFRYVGEYICGE